MFVDLYFDGMSLQNGFRIGVGADLFQALNVAVVLHQERKEVYFSNACVIGLIK